MIDIYFYKKVKNQSTTSIIVSIKLLINSTFYDCYLFFISQNVQISGWQQLALAFWSNLQINCITDQNLRNYEVAHVSRTRDLKILRRNLH